MLKKRSPGCARLGTIPRSSALRLEHTAKEGFGFAVKVVRCYSTPSSAASLDTPAATCGANGPRATTRQNLGTNKDASAATSPSVIFIFTVSLDDAINLRRKGII